MTAPSSTTLPLWIDESLITLCQRVRLQRRRTSFFIILVPMNGRVKFAMIGRGNWLDANRESAIVCNYRVGRMVMVAMVVASGLRVFV